MVSVSPSTRVTPDSVVVEVSSFAHPDASRVRAARLVPMASARVFMAFTLDLQRRGPDRHDLPVPTYVAFLRAINLGATRKFPKDAIKAATEAAGGTDVETYINTGNVRLTHPSRSVAKVQRALEEAYAGAAGFDVPTVVFTTKELA